MKLHEKRKSAGLTQAQLAEKIGVSRSAMQGYECGEKNFNNARIDTILNACILLNCAVEDIIDTEEYLDLIKKYQQLPKGKRRKLTLTEAREATGLSQSKFVAQCGINLRTWQGYECGKDSFCKARIDTILKVCLTAKCAVEDIIDNEDYIALIKKYHAQQNKRKK